MRNQHSSSEAAAAGLTSAEPEPWALSSELWALPLFLWWTVQMCRRSVKVENVHIHTNTQPSTWILLAQNLHNTWSLTLILNRTPNPNLNANLICILTSLNSQCFSCNKKMRLYLLTSTFFFSSVLQLLFFLFFRSDKMNTKDRKRGVPKIRASCADWQVR